MLFKIARALVALISVAAAPLAIVVSRVVRTSSGRLTREAAIRIKPQRAGPETEHG
jgi:hypothetical protein